MVKNLTRSAFSHDATQSSGHVNTNILALRCLNDITFVTKHLGGMVS